MVDLGTTNATKNKKVVLTIKIHAKFGSKHQESFAISALFQMLKAWRMYLLGTHKKNLVKYRIEGDVNGVTSAFYEEEEGTK